MSAYDDILGQIQAQKAFYKYDYGNSNLDPWLVTELARLIASTGVTDIRDISRYKTILPYADEYGNTSYMPISYFYDIVTGKQIKQIGGKDFNPKIADDVFASTNNSDYDFTFLIRFPGPYFVVGVKPREKVGSWFSMAAPLLPVALLALNIFAPGFATVLGNSILGPMGVTSTALATALGNVAIGTVTSGGNVEAAVKGALLGSLGASIGQAVGGTVGTSFNSDLLAKATSAATSAVITGGDPRLAVAGAFLPAGIQLVGDTFTDLTAASPAATQPSTGMTMSDIDYSVDYPWMADTGATFVTPLEPITSSWGNPVALGDLADYGGGTLAAGTYDFTTGASTDPSSSWGTPVTMGNTDYGSGTLAVPTDNYPFQMGNYDFSMTDAAGAPILASGNTADKYADTPSSAWMGEDAPPKVAAGAATADQTGTTWAAAASQIVLGALKLYTVYNSAGQPPIQTSGQTARGVVVAQPNGTVLVNGQVKLPPKGVPYLTPQGQLIMNNGDGTYSSISSTGLQTTTPYPTGMTSGALFGGMDSKTMMIVGGGLLAVLLLAR